MAALSGADSLLKRVDEKEYSQGDFPETADDAHVVFPIPMRVLILFCIALAVWHLICCWFGSVDGPLPAFSYFAPLPFFEYGRLVFVGSLVVGLFGVVMAVLCGLPDATELARRELLRMWMASYILLLFAGLALVSNNSLPRLLCLGEPSGKGEEPQSRRQRMFERLVNRRGRILRRAVILLALLVGYWIFLHWYIIKPLTAENRFPAFWRSVNVLSGVSPLMPQILLLFGLYGWFWFNLKGMALLSDARPFLPKESDFSVLAPDTQPPAAGSRPLLRILGREQSQMPVELQALPLGRPWLSVFPVCLLLASGMYFIVMHDWALRSLGELRFGRLVSCWLVVMMALLLTDTVQLLRTWSSLRRLLVLLDRLRLRRTLAAMKGIAWGSVWKMGGNVLEERYKVLSRALESLRNLSNELQGWRPRKSAEAINRGLVLDRTLGCLDVGRKFAEW